VILAGLDSSTQGTTALVVDDADGRVLARGRAPHRVGGVRGERRSDPRDWWAAGAAALAQTGWASRVQAIAVAAQQHGLVVLDGEGEPLAPASLWNDTTSAPDALALLEDLGGPGVWAQLTGSVPVAANTVCKWAHLRRSAPDLARRARAVRLPHEYLTERMCAAASGDRGDASGTGWWSPGEERYVPEVLQLARVALSEQLLTQVRRGQDPAGELCDRAAAELGLPAGIVVACGTGDNMAAAAALGLQPGTPVVSLGTSGTVYAASTTATADARGVLAGFADAASAYLPLACTLNATLAVDRFASWLGLDRDDVSAAGDVVVLPYLEGERTPNLPNASATIAGLRHDTSPQQILQAVYDGVAASLLDGVERLDALAGLDADSPLVLIGGGARGAAWQATLSAFTGRALVLPREPELVALGAAALAGAAASGQPAAALARRWRAAAGARVESRPRDEERLARIARVRHALAALDEG